MRTEGPYYSACNSSVWHYRRLRAWMSLPSASDVCSIVIPRTDKERGLFVSAEKNPVEELLQKYKDIAHWLESKRQEKGERLEVLRQRISERKTMSTILAWSNAHVRGPKFSHARREEHVCRTRGVMSRPRWKKLVNYQFVLYVHCRSPTTSSKSCPLPSLRLWVSQFH